MMKQLSTKKLVLSALFAALACVATMSVRIPTPGTGGYIHPGDAIVILCGIFLDPGAAFLAAGIGSCMADLLGGYFIYVPITFFIKGTIALLGSILYRRAGSRGANQFILAAMCGVIDIILVAGGYLLCEIPLYGLGAALASVPSNFIQGVSGLIISSALYPILQKGLLRVEGGLS